MKKILGLDLGTNSIGVALVSLPNDIKDFGTCGKIELLTSRIIPEDGEYLAKFQTGQLTGQTKAALRRQKRGMRRLKHRYKLRRTRLIRVFKALGWLDENFPENFKKLQDSQKGVKISDFLKLSPQTIQEFEREMGISDQFRFDKQQEKNVSPKLSEDWVIYYLRKKALTQKIEISELARIIYMFNQRRGFKSNRKDLKETHVLTYPEFIREYERLQSGQSISQNIETKFVAITKIKSVTLKEEGKLLKGDKKVNVYTIEADHPYMKAWDEERKVKPEWEGKEFTYLVTQKINSKRELIQLKPTPVDSENWDLITTALSESMGDKHPGEYFFEKLKENYLKKQHYKIRQYPVFRWRYKKELEAIWKKQCELNPDLNRLNTDIETLTKIAHILYPTQTKFCMAKFKELTTRNLLYIFSEDIIYYQRELKSQKNSIGECRYEKTRGNNGESYGVKCIPRSSPLFQEFRIWQDIHNMRVIQREVRIGNLSKLDVDVSNKFLTEEIKAELFELLNRKEKVTQSEILLFLKSRFPKSEIFLEKGEDPGSHRINLFANKKFLDGNHTLHRYRKLFSDAGYSEKEVNNFLENKLLIQKLWHADYSISLSDIEKTKKGLKKVIEGLFPESKNRDKLIELLPKLPELPKSYGSLSAKAIGKMLPYMRCGKFYDKKEEIFYGEISDKQKKKIEKQNARNEILKNSIMTRWNKIIERLNAVNHDRDRLNEVADDDINMALLKSFCGKTGLPKGLNTYQAAYLVYGKHSEKDIFQIDNPFEFGKYIQREIPNNSLRNPVVEKVIRETLLTVKDVWIAFGKIDEIHIELGRELKNNTEERKKISESQSKNRDEKTEIKEKLIKLLKEDSFEEFQDEDEFNIDLNNPKIKKVISSFTVKPNPENPSDIKKFGLWKSLSKYSDDDWKEKVKKENIPTDKQVKKYILWLSQNCRSPYTGKIIPLSKLFDGEEYNIEHVIPKSKLKNDSNNNLIICETVVNRYLKKDLLARNFIAEFGGKHGRTHEIAGKKFKIVGEEEYETYCKETFKKNRAKLFNLMATEVPKGLVERQINDTRYITRRVAELLAPVVGGINNIVFTCGAITSELKENWSLSSIWKEIMRPRFERLEKTMGRNYIITDENDANKFYFHVPENDEFELKRIDHRHHAMDALIIAATTREHIRYLNTLNAADTDEEIKQYRKTLVRGNIRDFVLPWPTFCKDAKDKLTQTIVSFKESNDIISKPSNRFVKWAKNEEGKAPVKKIFEQKSNPSWIAVKRSMFKEPLGTIFLKVVKNVDVKKALKVHIDRKLAESDKTVKTQSYVYDKNLRQIFDQLIDKSNYGITEAELLEKELLEYIKKNAKKITVENAKTKKTVYNLLGQDFDSARIAEFILTKVKRVSLYDKNYTKGLTLEKMAKDIPYFDINGKRNCKVNQVLFEHITAYENNPQTAFDDEGLENLQKRAIEKIGFPIKSITRMDGPVDKEKILNGAFYEPDKGANVYFIIYENKITKERIFLGSISVLEAIKLLNKSGKIAEQKEGYDTIILKPNDLVYVPTIEEQKGTVPLDWNNRDKTAERSERIYRVISFSEKSCYFLKANISTPIIPSDTTKKISGEIDWHNKSMYTMDYKAERRVQIQQVCIKIKVDRLGSISKA